MALHEAAEQPPPPVPPRTYKQSTARRQSAPLPQLPLFSLEQPEESPFMTQSLNTAQASPVLEPGQPPPDKHGTPSIQLNKQVHNESGFPSKSGQGQPNIALTQTGSFSRQNVVPRQKRHQPIQKRPLYLKSTTSVSSQLRSTKPSPIQRHASFHQTPTQSVPIVHRRSSSQDNGVLIGNVDINMNDFALPDENSDTVGVLKNKYSSLVETTNSYYGSRRVSSPQLGRRMDVYNSPQINRRYSTQISNSERAKTNQQIAPNIGSVGKDLVSSANPRAVGRRISSPQLRRRLDIYTSPQIHRRYSSQLQGGHSRLNASRNTGLSLSADIDNPTNQNSTNFATKKRLPIFHSRSSSHDSPLIDFSQTGYGDLRFTNHPSIPEHTPVVGAEQRRDSHETVPPNNQTTQENRTDEVSNMPLEQQRPEKPAPVPKQQSDDESKMLVERPPIYFSRSTSHRYAKEAKLLNDNLHNESEQGNKTAKKPAMHSRSISYDGSNALAPKRGVGIGEYSLRKLELRRRDSSPLLTGSQPKDEKVVPHYRRSSSEKNIPQLLDRLTHEEQTRQPSFGRSQSVRVTNTNPFPRQGQYTQSLRYGDNGSSKLAKLQQTDDIGLSKLEETNTDEMFKLLQETLDCEPDNVFELAAYALQASVGDYTDDDAARKHIKKLPLLPTRVLQEHPSISYCENKVIEYYKKISGTPRGSAVVSYMTLVESLPTYGIHYYEVKDKAGIPWWLGLSYKGISLYDYSDKRIPRRVFAWKQLENLYFRDRKFSIEVHDPKRIVHTLSSFNLYEDAIQEPLDQFDELSDAISDPTTQVSVSRRTFGPGNVNVHAWFASTPQLTKCIWSMAVSQHQFYLDRKQSKSQLPSARSVSEIAADLCASTTSLHSSGHSGDNISRSNSTHSLSRLPLSTHSSRTELTAEDLEASRQATRDMHCALKARKEALEQLLHKKTEELRQLCLKEGEITGEVPFEYPLSPGEPLPLMPRRIGTTFTISPDFIYRSKETEDEERVAKLELEFELQEKITEAALKLAKDPTVAKSVRKKRKQSYHKSSQKLKDIEKKLNEYRKHQGKNLIRHDYNSADDNEILSPVNSPHVPRHNDIISRPGYGYPRSASQGQVRIMTSPQVEVVELQQNHMRPSTPSSQGSGQRSGSPSSQGHHPYSHGISRGSTPSPGPQRRYGERNAPGYNPAPGYNHAMYRNASYPTFSSRHQINNNSDYDNSVGSNRSHENAHAQSNHVSSAVQQGQQEVAHNLYNLNLNRTSCYNSMDELKSPTSPQSEHYDSYPTHQNAPPNQYHNQPRSFPRTGSFESRSSNVNSEGYYNHHGSLDRDRRPGEKEPMIIPELIPSKFGSKRESHSDYRDSPYYNGPGSQRHDMNRIQDGGYTHNPPQGVATEPPRTHYGPGSAIPFIDSSHSSLTSSASSNYYYDKHDPAAIRQQNPPSTPQFESPPPAVIRHESPQPQGHQYHPHAQNIEYSQGPQIQPPQGAIPSMTVTKYSNYVEVSKPFEMADVYKYSEKIRKTRYEGSPSEGAPNSPAHSSASGSSSQRAHSPFMQRTVAHVTSRSRSASPAPGSDTSGQYLSSQYPHPRSHSSHSQIHKSYQTSQQSANQVARHIQYQSPQPQTCNAIGQNSQGHSASSTPHRSFNDSQNGSFGSFNLPNNEAQDFRQEMLAWYEDHDHSERSAHHMARQENSTLV